MTLKLWALAFTIAFSVMSFISFVCMQIVHRSMIRSSEEGYLRNPTPKLRMIWAVCLLGFVLAAIWLFVVCSIVYPSPT